MLFTGICCIPCNIQTSHLYFRGIHTSLQVSMYTVPIKGIAALHPHKALRLLAHYTQWPRTLHANTHRRPPPPLRKFSSSVIYFPLKKWAFETPSNIEFPLTFLGMSMDAFLELHYIRNLFTAKIVQFGLKLNSLLSCLSLPSTLPKSAQAEIQCSADGYPFHF